MQKQQTRTKSYKVYVSQWSDYIIGMNSLLFVADKELSKEVAKALDNLNNLVVKVANVKFQQNKKT